MNSPSRSLGFQHTRLPTHSVSDQLYTAKRQTLHYFISLYLRSTSVKMFILKLSLLAYAFFVAVQGVSVTRQAQPQTPGGDWVPWERINRNDSVSHTSIPCRHNRLIIPSQALLIIDHQVGLFQLARDWDGTLFKQNLLAHATMAKLFDIPVVMTSSAETGPNGPLLKDFTDILPNAPYIKRTGEVKCVFPSAICLG